MPLWAAVADARAIRDAFKRDFKEGEAHGPEDNQ